MGRHSSPAKRSNLRSPIVLLSAALVLVLVGWLVFDLVRNQLSGTDCDAVTTVNVTTTPDVAPVIDAVGRKAVEEDPAACYKINVSSRDSASTAEALALTDSGDAPDVWIPESTLWLRRAQDKGAWTTPVQGTPVASSPVVLALTEDVAGQLGWPDATPTWAEALTADAVKTSRVGFPDPARDPVGLAALFGVRDVVAASADPGAALTSQMRRLSDSTLPQASDLYARLPGGGGSGDPFAIFPTSETALLRHNVKSTGTELVAVYPTSAIPALDYPYTVLPGTTNEKRDVAQRFLGRLTSGDAVNAFGDAGFRAPDGKVLRDRSKDRRTTAAPVTAVPVPDSTTIDQVLNAWAAVNLSARIQVLLDVSGSMGQNVPGTPLNRMDITIKAAETGIALFRPTTKFGLWLFSVNLDGDKEYRELLPVSTVAEHLAQGALDKLRTVKAVEGGATGLYDTVLAAYQASRQNWEPGRINLVVVLTDGKNDNASGITREALLAELAKLQDPKRPLPVIGIGIGPDVDPAELQAITGATGGQALIAADPAKMNEVFFAALSKLLCQPPACKPTP